ncbi:MAG: hypothetical protein IT428_10370 [Planctomycetaceae bacterium]|nr:hypothetical protein [Planctomycetaceae bacterium]
MQRRIMYIERKEGLTGPARIGWVRFSQTGKTLYYESRAFQSLKGAYKANYRDTETLEWYWICGPRKDGMDALYPAIVEIDEDAREEYWSDIRDQPESVRLTSFRSPGKYSRRTPRPELNSHGASRNGGNRRSRRR